jgi:hypothetical protein
MRQRVDFSREHTEHSPDYRVDSSYLDCSIDSSLGHLQSPGKLDHPLLREEDHSVFSSEGAEDNRIDSYDTDGEVVDLWEYTPMSHRDKEAQRRTQRQQGQTQGTMHQQNMHQSTHQQNTQSAVPEEASGVPSPGGRQLAGRNGEERTISEAISEDGSRGQSGEWSRLGARSWSRID